MATHSITIKNMSHAPRRFLLFQDMPAPSNGPSGEVFSHVYQRSPTIMSGPDSQAIFVMKPEYFAIYGTSSKNDDGSVQVSTSASQPVKLGPSGSVVVLSTQDEQGDTPVWDMTAMAGQTCHASGRFSLVTDNSFKYPSPTNIYVGCGASDPRDPSSITPIQTYIAEPGLNSQLFPCAKYYVCFGEHEVGTVVDRNALDHVLQVDFTHSAVPSATFTFTEMGSYEADDSVSANGIRWSFDDMSDS